MTKALSLLVFLGAGVALPQTPTATITGEVRDPSGSAIVGGKVTMRNTGTNMQRAVLSNESGRYVIPLLPPGLYELVVEAPGFKRTRSGIELQVSQEGRVDVRLELGQVSEVVEVRAEDGWRCWCRAPFSQRRIRR